MPYAFKAEYSNSLNGSLKLKNGKHISWLNNDDSINTWLVSSLNGLTYQFLNNGAGGGNVISIFKTDDEKNVKSFSIGNYTLYGKNNKGFQLLDVYGGAYIKNNLGIGIINPTEKLEVLGNVKIISPKSELHHNLCFERTDQENRRHRWRIYHMNHTYHENSFQIWEYKTDSKGIDCNGSVEDGAICSRRFMIDTGGKVAIGTQYPTQQLDVNGTIACNTILETSDIRYKKNITPIQTPLQKVTQLKGINYEWKTEDYPEKNFSNGKQIGMIAQDVEKVIPEIVHTDNEGMKSISYDKITAVLVEAMKELNQKNEKAIQELKAENAQLKQVICEDRPNHEFCQN